MTVRNLCLQLPVEPEAAGAARQALTRLAGCTPGALVDVKTVASELVTNVVLHSGLRAPDTLQLTADCYEASVRIAVRDTGVGFDRDGMPLEDRPPGTGGLGLRLVDRLSLRSGVYALGGTVAWAEVATRPAVEDS